MHRYLFVLSPPYCGSTVLWQLLRTSPQVSALPGEGTRLPAVKEIMTVGKWNPEHSFPWLKIKEEWSKVWDLNKAVLLEKSPPNILRAKEIEQIFSPCSFIVLMRDPYALCEGLARRRNRRSRLFRNFQQKPPCTGNHRDNAMRFAAGLWLRFATYQIRNIRELERVIHFTYEDLTGNTSEVVSRIVDFLPELGDLDINKKFRVHSITGTDDRVLIDMNRTKWECLQRRDIAIINEVLADHRESIEFFGYGLRQPDRLQDLRSAFVRSRALFLKLKNEGREAMLGRRTPTLQSDRHASGELKVRIRP